jgi:predicted acylesterase/phospholipase RssA
MASDRVFELGIVLAGAVSAGAYSAGVMDFLIEALDAFEAAKADPGWDGPTHVTRVPVMAGASAGGMTAAVAALQAFRDIAHVWQGERSAQVVKSALCSDVLDEIVKAAFDMAGPVKIRNWLGRGDDRSLRVMMTLTNMRGVPYSFALYGEKSAERFGMLNHADYLDFRVGVAPASIDAVYPLDVTAGDDPNKALFGTAALATGAFPAGLAPRHIARAASDYLKAGKVGYYDAQGQFVSIHPDSRLPSGTYSFVSVDGGTIDNEPLELARRYLTGQGPPAGQDGQDADKAIVLIAPFPNYKDAPAADERDTVLHIVSGLASALIDQARFKPDELAQAANDKNFSRFVISPARPSNGNPMAAKYPIASGALGGFSGFLDESFRRHDYLLGRRNAQAFLRWNFALPETNPLFAGEKPVAPAWRVAEANGATGSLTARADAALPRKKFATTASGGETTFGLPIIPLTEAMRAPIEIGPAGQPRPGGLDLDVLHAMISKRVAKVVEILVDVDLRPETDALGPVFGLAVREGGRKFGAEVATRKANAIVDAAIRDLIQAFPSGA